MYCVVVSYLTNRISASFVQFRAGSSITGSGGSLHPAAQIISHPLYDYDTTDFDVAVVRVSENVRENVSFLKNKTLENGFKHV